MQCVQCTPCNLSFIHAVKCFLWKHTHSLLLHRLSNILNPTKNLRFSKFLPKCIFYCDFSMKLHLLQNTLYWCVRVQVSNELPFRESDNAESVENNTCMCCSSAKHLFYSRIKLTCCESIRDLFLVGLLTLLRLKNVQSTHTAIHRKFTFNKLKFKVITKSNIRRMLKLSSRKPH